MNFVNFYANRYELTCSCYEKCLNKRRSRIRLKTVETLIRFGWDKTFFSQWSQ